jgi:PEP-CTERM motif
VIFDADVAARNPLQEVAMFQIIRKLAAVLALGLVTVGVAQASAVYNFSYGPMQNSTVITGSFTGDANGNLITNLTNINVFFNGVAFTANGSLFASSYNGNFVSGGGVASFDGTQNNFLFIDVDFPNNVAYTQYFYDVSVPQFTGASDIANAFNGQVVDSLAPPAGSAWSVTAANAVPEPMSLALAGIGLIGAAVARRRRR